MLNQFSSDSDFGFGRLLELGGTIIQERMKTLFVFSFSSGTAGAHSALFLSDLKTKKRKRWFVVWFLLYLRLRRITTATARTTITITAAATIMYRSLPAKVPGEVGATVGSVDGETDVDGEGVVVG